MNIKNKNLSTNMIIGSIGLILATVGTGILIFIPDVEKTFTLVMIFFGLSLTIHYIYYLERKAGVSNRVIWFRSIIIIITVSILSAILF